MSLEAHPEPGKPDHLACWEPAGSGTLVPCGDVFSFWTGLHRCPRFEHLTQDSPPGECTAAPVDSDPVTGTATVALNPADGQRGYLGVELARAPVAPGGYYLGVRSVGSTPYRIRPAAHLHQRSSPEHELEGGFVFFTVLGGEILDENFQRVEALDVDQPKIAYVRFVDPGEVEDTITLIFETFDEDGELVDRIDALDLTRVGRSAVFLSAAIELHPGFTEPGGAQAMSSSTQRSRTAPKGAAKVRNPSRDVARAATRWGDTYVVPFGLTLPLKLYRSQAFNDLVSPPRHYICSEPAGDCPQLQDVLVDPAAVLMSIEAPAGADAEGERQLARLELEPGPDPAAGWYLRGIRMTINGAGLPMTWSNGSVRAPEGRLTVKATSPLLGSPVTARVAVARPTSLGCCATASCPGFGACTTIYPAPATVVDLEPLVIAEADANGIPPHYLMAQAVQEAGTFQGRLNAYAFRYEPTSRDFKIATGDHGTSADSQRFLLHPHKALMNLAVGPGSAIGYLPCELTSGDNSADGDPILDPTTHLPSACVPGQTPPAFYSAALVQDPADASRATWLIPSLPVGAVLQLGVKIYSGPDPWAMPWDQTGFSQVYGAAPAAATEYTVDPVAGRITFGGPQSAMNALYRLRVHGPQLPGSGLGASFAAGSTPAQLNATIRANNPPENNVPPLDLSWTIRQWRQQWGLAAPNRLAGTNFMHRYCKYFPSSQLWRLMYEDPSFDVQGQWFASASYGLLQVIPESLRARLHGAAFPSAVRGEILAEYNPQTHNPEKLFSPATCIKLGAMMDAKATVTSELSDTLVTGEDACVVERKPSACTWDRVWKRRFRVFNSGSESTKPPGVVQYANDVVGNSQRYLPLQ